MQLNFEQPDFIKKIFPGYIGIPIPVPIKITGNFPSKFSATEIHGEFYSCINVYVVTIIHNLVFSHEFSCNCIASKTTLHLY